MTLICLISGQLAPNLLSVIKLNPANVVLVHTVDTSGEAVHFRELITKRYGVQNSKLVEVVPFNPEEINLQAQSLLQDLGKGETILNYTGGTKPIAIQFTKVFEKANSKLLYTDTQQECFWWTENGKTREEGFNFRFKLPTYFDLKQVLMRSQTDKNQIDLLKQLTQYLFDERKKGRKSDLKPFLDHAVKVRVSKKSPDQWDPAICTSRLMVESDNLDHEKICVIWNEECLEYKNKQFWLDYFTGGWFEQWVYLQLINQNVFDDVRCNVTIRPNDNYRSGSLKSEIDVAAIYNAVPIFIECKLGRVDQKSITNIKAIRDEYGPRYSQAILVSFYPVMDKVLREKISDYGIVLIEGPLELETRLSQILEDVVVRL